MGGTEEIIEKIGDDTIKRKITFDENRGITKEQIDDGSGGGYMIDDPFALFQPGDFVISAADLEYFTTNAENQPDYDFDGNGVVDAIEVDNDNDGNIDAVYNFAKHLLQSTLFVQEPDVTANFDSDNKLVSLTLNGSADSVSHLLDDHYGKFDLTMTGDYEVLDISDNRWPVEDKMTQVLTTAKRSLKTKLTTKKQ